MRSVKIQGFYLLFLFLTSLTAVSAQIKPERNNNKEDTSMHLQNYLHLRDPFRKPMLKVSTEVTEGGSIPELERYPLDQLKLIGIITGPKKNKALLTTPNGRMHIVTERMHVGNRRGLIKRIVPGTILVEEKVVNLLGQEEKIETTLEFEKEKL